MLIFDAGKVEQDAVITHTFTIKNSTPQSFRITNVIPSCSCTTTVPAEPLVNKDAERKMTVTYRVGRRKGLSEQSVLVVTDSPATKSYSLVIRCLVASAFEYAPNTIDFGDVVHGDPTSRSVTLWDANFEELEIEKADVSSTSFEALSKKIIGDIGDRADVPATKIELRFDSMLPV
jgi:hypothetical protein